MNIRRALVSVSKKTGIIEFAAGLQRFGVEIVSTGGTAGVLAAAGLSVRTVEQLTGWPEMLGGRVKTLHPMVHGGILGRRQDPIHQREMFDHRIERIDLVCVNLYPFADTVAKGAEFAECIEQIDIGGPAMLRSAAKNHEDVIVLVDPADYAGVLADLRDGNPLSPEARRHLAWKVFQHTAAYDAAIAQYLAGHIVA